MVLKRPTYRVLSKPFAFPLKLSTDEVKVKIIGSGVGGITETDASSAAASNAIILGFNVRADGSLVASSIPRALTCVIPVILRLDRRSEAGDDR